MMPERPTRGASGFTLIEAIIATLIVSVMTVAALNAIPAVVDGRVRNERFAMAASLAQDLMGEIDAQGWEDPDVSGSFGPGPATRRNQFNDCDDYDGWVESPPTDRDGVAYPGMTNWSRSVEVEYVSVSAPDTVSGARTTLKRVTVTASFRGMPLARIVRLRSSVWDDAIPDRIVDEPVLVGAPLGVDVP